MTTTVRRAVQFIQQCATGMAGEYRFYPDGQVSLYSSCYAVMARHYVGDLANLSREAKKTWCEYLNSWQDPSTGFFLGPELAASKRARTELSKEYLSLHLLVHVLPSLELLGGAPTHPLHFAEQFVDPANLLRQLDACDWKQAWYTGNYLLCVGQVLLHLFEKEGDARVRQALEVYFDWLDAQVDPATGLWGTNGFCDAYEATYGGAHQLLVYYRCRRPVMHAERIIDTVLSLQQADGSFTRTPGGGSCEDVDSIDVLVNLTKRTNGYRFAEVISALRRAQHHVMAQQAADGGFVYSWGRSYMQNGLLSTFTPQNRSEIFSTWYRLHTLALISQIFTDDPELSATRWQFNRSCSMGWHDVTLAPPVTPKSSTGLQRAKKADKPGPRHNQAARKSAVRTVLKLIPVHWVEGIWRVFLPRYVRSLSPQVGIGLLLTLDRTSEQMGAECSYELGGGLHVEHWSSQFYYFYTSRISRDSRVIHLGCADGSLSYALSSLAGAHVIAIETLPGQAQQAQRQFHHPHLIFSPDIMPLGIDNCVDFLVLTDLDGDRPAWNRWERYLNAHRSATLLVQLSPAPINWRHLGGWSDGFVSPATVSDLAPVVRSIPSPWRISEAEVRSSTVFASLVCDRSVTTTL